MCIRDRINTEVEDSDRTSQWNPDAAEFVPVSPSRFMMDPDPVISSSPMHGYEKSLDNVALPSQVEFNLDIAHRPGQLDSMVGNVDDTIVTESGEGEESEERSADAAQGSIAVSYTHLDVYKRQELVFFNKP